MKGIDWSTLEIEALIKPARFFVDRMNHDSPRTDNVGGFLDSLQGIKQECFTKPSALIATVDR